MIKTYNQRSPKYGDLTLGDSGVDFNKNGCTTCAMLVGHSLLFPGNPLPPEEAVNLFDYTDKKRYPKKKAGLFIWDDYDGMEFVKRRDRKPTHQELTEYSQFNDRFMILEIDGGLHWVFHYWNTVNILPWILVVDSYPDNFLRKDGKIRTLNKRRITGFACYFKKPQP